MATAHVLIADITGSTTLYDQMSDSDALALISVVLNGMRTIIEDNGGHCVKSQGDDTLSFFDDADQVFQAARQMIEADWGNGLGVHAGVCHGEVVSHDADIYGDAVNTAARLSTLSKAKEVLLSDTVFERLSERNSALCVAMGGITLKGKREATRVHSFAVSDMTTQTVFLAAQDSIPGPCTESAALTYGEAEWTLYDGESLMVGRSDECEAVLELPWVSRKHGSFELRAAQLEYTDHSSSGSTVITADGQEFKLQRRSMPLSGSGVVLVGTRDRALDTSLIRYDTNDLRPD
ncbi:Adenylate cyclase [Sulfitobacter noctilucicola]|uniref:Class 3 adenylate cyclase n=1 Tax=Sulfitobacter noctilucicola TaxID=1342301 RepID=A0A7W6M724_9RHOB|nr:adenylate/guanylate cyclase domain-containing protein [Sulfitobacter noctilucicola]KIN61912.1 Adenylate cyclase [Sulfitobacter noctilucicola]MBB4173566.1 class 3 adenylate cyclase [Sulfitobacter noctilucicola]